MFILSIDILSSPISFPSQHFKLFQFLSSPSLCLPLLSTFFSPTSKREAPGATWCCRERCCLACSSWSRGVSRTRLWRASCAVEALPADPAVVTLSSLDLVATMGGGEGQQRWRREEEDVDGGGRRMTAALPCPDSAVMTGGGGGGGDEGGCIDGGVRRTRTAMATRGMTSTTVAMGGWGQQRIYNLWNFFSRFFLFACDRLKHPHGKIRSVHTQKSIWAVSKNRICSSGHIHWYIVRLNLPHLIYIQLFWLGLCLINSRSIYCF